MECMLELSFNSNFSKAKKAVDQIMLFLEENISQISADDKFYLKLMLSELVFNAVRHGNRNDPKKLVHVSIDVKGIDINCVITDEGNGFDFSSLLDKPAIADLESENGRGLRLVRSLADQISFSSTGNEISFLKRVSIDG